jgi:hypothetical protein
MAPRRAAPTVHTLDRALQETQRELASLRLQLSPQATSPPRQGPLGSGKRFGFGRGLEQLRHEINNEDFRPAIAHDHYLLIAVKKVEITEAYWVPDDDWTTSALNYSYIRLQEHLASRDYRNSTEAKQLGYISGQPKTAGEWATGSLRKGYPYRFRLEEQPITEPRSLVVCDTRASTNVNLWPTGYIIVCYRWLD